MGSESSTAQIVRAIQWHTGSSTREVQISIWEPVLVARDDTAVGAAVLPQYECRFSVVGLPNLIESKTSHLDSLGAVIFAIGAVHSLLKPYLANLSYLGIKGEHGIPRISHWFEEPSENRYIEQLIETEEAHYMSIARPPRSNTTLES